MVKGNNNNNNKKHTNTKKLVSQLEEEWSATQKAVLTAWFNDQIQSEYFHSTSRPLALALDNPSASTSTTSGGGKASSVDVDLSTDMSLCPAALQLQTRQVSEELQRVREEREWDECRQRALLE